jgi:hypothetical protein
MKLRLHIDTNDYNEDGDLGTVNETQVWSLFNLCLKTFQDWKTAGQTGFWTIDGEIFCGTAYECEINYKGSSGELLLRCLIDKIKEVCGDRYINLWIDDVLVKFTDDDCVEMRPEWIEVMK